MKRKFAYTTSNVEPLTDKLRIIVIFWIDKFKINLSEDFMLVPSVPDTTKIFLQNVRFDDPELKTIGIYEVPCNDCSSLYTGKTFDLKKS